MATIKERKVKGRTYVYVSASATYKGETKRFEKSVGSKELGKLKLERRKEFYSWIIDQKKEFYLMYLEIKNLRLRYLSKGYAFPLIFIKRQYELELKNYYPGELEKYREGFDIRYIYNTTALEGNTLTIQETGLVLDKGLAPARKKLREIHEIDNFKKVLQFRRNHQRDISSDFILKLHELIQRNIDDECAGTFRKVPIFISGSHFEPPPAIIVEDEMKKLIKWYNTNKHKMNPLELAADFHHRFVDIHPFVDGNGRVGRELLNFILQKNDYPAIIIPVDRREEYIDALETAHDGNLKPFMEFLVEIFVEDYAKVIRGNMEKFLQEFGELDREEVHEVMETVKWSQDLIKKYVEKTPQHLLEIIQRIMK